jgi:acyl-coenzyme A thioesterase PaaI-like protein
MQMRHKETTSWKNNPTPACVSCAASTIPSGLAPVKFYTDDEGRCIARFQPKPEHQGYPGHLHGGIISTPAGRPNSNFNAL